MTPRVSHRYWMTGGPDRLDALNDELDSYSSEVVQEPLKSASVRQPLGLLRDTG